MRMYANEFSPSLGWGASNLLHTNYLPMPLKAVMSSSGKVIVAWVEWTASGGVVMTYVRY